MTAPSHSQEEQDQYAVWNGKTATTTTTTTTTPTTTTSQRDNGKQHNTGIVLHHHQDRHHHQHPSALWKKAKRIQKAISIVRNRKAQKSSSSHDYVCTMEPTNSTVDAPEWQVSIAARLRGGRGGQTQSLEDKQDLYASSVVHEAEGLPIVLPSPGVGPATRKRHVTGSSVFGSNGSFSVEGQMLHLQKCPLSGHLKFKVNAKDWTAQQRQISKSTGSTSFDGTVRTSVKLENPQDLCPELEEETAALLSLLSTNAVLDELEKMEREMGEESDTDIDDDDDNIAFEVRHLHNAEEELEHELDGLTLQDIDSFVVAAPRAITTTTGEAASALETTQPTSPSPVLTFSVKRRSSSTTSSSAQFPPDARQQQEKPQMGTVAPSRMEMEGSPRYLSPLMEGEEGREESSRRNNFSSFSVPEIMARSRGILNQTFSQRRNPPPPGASWRQQRRRQQLGEGEEEPFVDEELSVSHQPEGFFFSFAAFFHRIGELFVMCAGMLFPTRHAPHEKFT